MYVYRCGGCGGWGGCRCERSVGMSVEDVRCGVWEMWSVGGVECGRCGVWEVWSVGMFVVG